jgi:hypothetical protein
LFVFFVIFAAPSSNINKDGYTLPTPTKKSKAMGGMGGMGGMGTVSTPTRKPSPAPTTAKPSQKPTKPPQAASKGKGKKAKASTSDEPSVASSGLSPTNFTVIVFG